MSGLAWARLQAGTSRERAEYFQSQFRKLGIPTEVQDYSFKLKHETVAGSNSYAINPSPRSSGTEAMVISAPWLSHSGEGTVNVRGVSMVLALAQFLKKHNLWAKDLIFIISDGSMDGMHAFLSAYYGSIPNNLKTNFLNITSGAIWTAINIDYPGHSFAELGLYHEGLNARLPNQDLLNSFTLISGWTAQVPVTLYVTTRNSVPFPLLQNVLPKFIKEDHRVQEYLRRGRDILKHASYQALGKASGVHGLFHQYHIDAFTMYAIPDVGPHGFHSMGRIIESTLRTTNNLLERLHASFFFYILTSPSTFLQLGHYLPAVIIISLATMMGALNGWVDAGWEKVALVDVKGPTLAWKTRSRNVMDVLWMMFSAHLMGGAMWYIAYIPHNFPLVSIVLMSYVLIVVGSLGHQKGSTHSMTLQALMLSITSAVLSITSLLNFTLSVVLATILAPLAFTRTSAYWPFLCALVDVGVRVLKRLEMGKQWQMFGVWTEPFYYFVVIPLMLEGALVCAL